MKRLGKEKVLLILRICDNAFKRLVMIDLYYSLPFFVKRMIRELPERKSEKMSSYEDRAQYTYRYDLMIDSC